MIAISPTRGRRALTAALAGLALLPVAGCGGEDSAAGSGDGLARFAPAAAPFYVEGVVRPEGERKADLDALIGTFAPGRTAEEIVRKAFASSGTVDYARDIEPWLGESAALAVTGMPAGEGRQPDVAGIIETTDPEKALAAVRKRADGQVEERSHAGVDYLLDTGARTAGAIVDETLVIGTEPALKAVVDASQGKGLDTNPEFSKVVDAVDEDALGLVYGDLRRTLELARDTGGVEASDLEGFRELLDRRGITTFAAGLVATPKAVTIRAAAVAAGKENGAAAELLAGLPAGSWAAVGLGDLGRSLSEGLDSLASLSGPGLDVRRGLEQLEQQAGLDVQEDLLSWMGQAGLFARGTSLTDIGGALVVQSKDPAKTRAALAQARTLAAGAGLPTEDLSGAGIDDGFSVSPGGAPVAVFAALAGDRFVLALNRDALDEALDPAAKLGDSDAFKAAAEQLGDDLRPTLFLDVSKVAGLIGLAAAGQPGFAEAKPYLDKITTIVAGSRRDGDLQLQTLSIGVR